MASYCILFAEVNHVYGVILLLLGRSKAFFMGVTLLCLCRSEACLMVSFHCLVEEVRHILWCPHAVCLGRKVFYELEVKELH